MKLAFVGEIHPKQIIENIPSPGLYDSSCCNMAESQLALLEKEPEKLCSPEFWAQVKDLYDNALANDYDPLEGIVGVYKLSLGKIQRIHHLNMQSLDIARQIWLGGHDIIKSGQYKTLYFEGDRKKPALMAAQQSGLEIISLDEGNVFYEELVRQIRAESEMGGMLPAPFNHLQAMREGLWIPRFVKDGLVNVGTDHAENRWNLLGYLAEKGIEIEVISTGKKEAERYKVIEAERDQLLATGFERYLDVP